MVKRTARRIVSRKEWNTARKALLKKEKQFTHLREELAEQRRALPWAAMVPKNRMMNTINLFVLYVL